MTKPSTHDKRYKTLGMIMLVCLSLCSTSRAAETDTSNAVSQFADEVGKLNYTEANPPSAAPVFRWDFSKPNVVHAYTYEQEVRIKMDIGASLGGNSDDTSPEMSAKGALLVKSQGDNTANLVLKDVQMSMKIDTGEDEPKTVKQKMPLRVLQGMKEDGSGSFGNNSQDMALKVLFPLPTKPLKVGDSVDVPAQMPFNAMGSMLQFKGHSRITLTRYVKIGKRTCAQLDVDTDISKLKVPSELEGEYKGSTKGTSVFYFDVASRSFVSGTIALVMQFSIDAPMPQMRVPGEDRTDMPKRDMMSMTSDNLIRVELRE